MWALALIFTTSTAGAEVASPSDGGTQAESAESRSDKPSLLEPVRLARQGLPSGPIQELKGGGHLISAMATAAEIHHTSMLPVGRRSSSIPVDTVLVSEGRIDGVLPEGRRRGLLLQTKDNIQAICTAGRVAMVAQADRIAVAALEGEALVGKAGIFRALQPGRVRVYDRLSGSFSERSLLGATSLKKEGLSVAIAGPAKVGVRPQRVEGARGYKTILLSDTGRALHQVAEHDGVAELSLQVPHAGDFLVVARAIDEFGFAGAPSAPLKVSVLGIVNGESVVRHGLIFLAPGQMAQVVGQGGLMMRYGTSPEYVPAPASIGLPGQKATTVEFRDPKDSDRYAVFRLAPRVLRTRIDIGPGRSTWPRDTLQLRVRMWDGHGQPLSWMDEYKVTVRVGLEEVDVDWQRSNGQLQASLPPQRGPGPWVVRVSVADPNEQELARNFLEVSPSDEKFSPPPLTRTQQVASR